MEAERGLFTLDGSVAIVSGGSRGLGLEIALALGRAGAQIVITGRRDEWLKPAAAMLSDSDVEALAVRADAVEPLSARRVLATALSAFGRVDILVNSVGITWSAPVLEMPLDKWRNVLDVNTTSAFLMAQIVAGHLIAEAKPGRIINVASVYGLVGAPADVMDAIGYSASKGALIALTREFAVKWAPYGILVNAIAPSFFRTRLTAVTIDQNAEAILDDIPLGRHPELWEVGGVAVFLASRASTYITGQVIAVDGGLTAR